MSLVKMLRSVLGLDSDDSEDERGDRSSARRTEVAVEHEPDTESEDAVKGTGTAGSGDGEPVAAETDAAGSTASITEEPPDEPGEAAEPAEAAGPASQVEESEPGPGAEEPAVEAGGADEEAEEAGEEAEGSAPVDTISGIGPAYAERLGNAGVETVGDLAAADAAGLADETGLGEGRVTDWIERARGG